MPIEDSFFEDGFDIYEEMDDSDYYDDGRFGGDYCEHGTYIGTPGGADFLCGACEMGDE